MQTEMDYEKEYSPSQWSQRLAPDVIVQKHGEFFKNSNFLIYHLN